MNKGEIAEQFFRNGYNCSQAVACAFTEETGLSEAEIARFTIGFGGGMARMRNVCGAVSGMAFVISALFAQEGRASVYEKIQHVAGVFEEKNGSMICGELLGLNKKEKCSPVPDERTPQYYKKRPCPALVHMAADILDAFLKGEKTE